MLHEIAGTEDADQIAKRCLSRLRPSFLVGGETAQIGASIGIALYPDDAGDSEALLAAADRAMYWAKQRGRNTFASAAEMVASE